MGLPHRGEMQGLGARLVARRYAEAWAREATPVRIVTGESPRGGI